MTWNSSGEYLFDTLSPSHNISPQWRRAPHLFLHFPIQLYVIFTFIFISLAVLSYAIATLSFSSIRWLQEILVTGVGAVGAAAILSVSTIDSWLIYSDNIGADSVGAAILMDTSRALRPSISISSSNCWAVTIESASTVLCWLVLLLSHTFISIIVFLKMSVHSHQPQSTPLVFCHLLTALVDLALILVTFNTPPPRSNWPRIEQLLLSSHWRQSAPLHWPYMSDPTFQSYSAKLVTYTALVVTLSPFSKAYPMPMVMFLKRFWKNYFRFM